MDLSLFKPTALQPVENSLQILLETNATTTRHGLILTKENGIALLQTREKTLRNTGRIEFGQNSAQRIILAFCDSPFLTQSSYGETLQDLLECFYALKNDTFDRVDDEELLQWMADTFNGRAKGSVSYLYDLAIQEFLYGELPSEEEEMDADE